MVLVQLEAIEQIRQKLHVDDCHVVNVLFCTQ
jgi:hypothetical protein